MHGGYSFYFSCTLFCDVANEMCPFGLDDGVVSSTVEMSSMYSAIVLLVGNTEMLLGQFRNNSFYFLQSTRGFFLRWPTNCCN